MASKAGPSYFIFKLFDAIRAKEPDPVRLIAELDREALLDMQGELESSDWEGLMRSRLAAFQHKIEVARKELEEREAELAQPMSPEQIARRQRCGGGEAVDEFSLSAAARLNKEIIRLQVESEIQAAEFASFSAALSEGLLQQTGQVIALALQTAKPKSGTDRFPGVY